MKEAPCLSTQILNRFVGDSMASKQSNLVQSYHVRESQLHNCDSGCKSDSKIDCAIVLNSASSQICGLFATSESTTRIRHRTRN